jgi:acylphosphatase
MQQQNSKLNQICVRILVSGKVQGVGYRASTLRQAKKLGISGWVRNLLDNRVEALFEGDTTAVEQMIAWCRIGPSAAKVKDVFVEELEFNGLKEFEIR